MAHPKVTNVVLIMKPKPAFSPLGDELAWQSDVSLGQLLREGPITAVQRQMRDSSENRQTAVSKRWVLFLRKHHSMEFCFVSLRKVYNDFRQCVQGTRHAIHVSSFIDGSQPDHICACGQGNPRNPSSFSKPPSAAVDQTKSDYILYALLKTLATANMGEIVLYFL